MQNDQAVGALGALAHATRLDVFRLLVKAGHGGLPAGEIARLAGCPASTLSGNLNILAAAGLVASRRDGRSIIYTADYDAMRGLLAFLMEDCCGGAPEICAPLASIASQSCSAEGACA